MKGMMIIQHITCAAIWGLIVFSANSQLQAQNTNWCAADTKFREQLQSDPEYAERYRQIKQNLAQWQSSGMKGPQALVTIPVVVHVVHNGDALGVEENITDDQIRSQIEVLNNDFQKLDPNSANVPPAFQSLIADFQIEFCLAARDPQGYPATGIQRINGGRNIWNLTQADAFKPSTIWDPDTYLNIWVMRIGGTSSGTLGYAKFPWDADSINGIIVDYKAFGTTGNLLAGHEHGKTTTHEVGHWLGLFHVWGDDSGACNQDDDVNDTPVQASENYGCPTFPKISCNNGPNGDMFMNYMDYTDDGCSGMFTIGQKARASLLLQTMRTSILSSSGCTPTTANERDLAITKLIYPTSEICVENVVPTVEVWNIGGAPVSNVTFSYQIDGGILKQYQWNGWIPTYGRDIIQLPTQNLSFGAHDISIYISGLNGSNDQNSSNDGADINFNIVSIGIGNPMPASEGFDSGILPNLWEIENPDGDRTWIIDTSTGQGGSSGSIVFDNFSNTGTNPSGRRDGLITPEYDFRTTLYPYLTFKVAYAQRLASTDSLIIYYSLDCGNSWTRIYANGGATLATAPDQTAAFVPQESEWREDWAALSHLAGHYKVKFKFENYSDYGNKIYLDNIRIDLSVTGIGNSSTDENIKIYPNPTGGNLQVEINLKQKQNLQLEILNISGKVLRSLPIAKATDKKFPLDISEFPKGFYMIRISGDRTSIIKKVILE